MLAAVAQKVGEPVFKCGVRVGEVLETIIEVIEEKNSQKIAYEMVASARDTANENFVMGLRRALALCVKVDSRTA